MIDTRHGQRILHTRKIPLLDEHGEATHLVGITEDITERKRAEEELQTGQGGRGGRQQGQERVSRQRQP